MDTIVYMVLTRQEVVSRRQEAVRMFLNGATRADISHRYGVHRTTVSRWLKREVNDVGAMPLGCERGLPARAM